jgi:hypothetical protein
VLKMRFVFQNIVSEQGQVQDEGKLILCMSRTGNELPEDMT